MIHKDAEQGEKEELQRERKKPKTEKVWLLLTCGAFVIWVSISVLASGFSMSHKRGKSGRQRNGVMETKCSGGGETD